MLDYLHNVCLLKIFTWTQYILVAMGVIFFFLFFFWLSLQLIGTWGCGRQRFACMHIRKSNFLLSREFPTRLFRTMRYPEIACREFQKEQGILKILFPWPSEELLLKIPVLFFFFWCITEDWNLSVRISQKSVKFLAIYLSGKHDAIAQDALVAEMVRVWF